MCGGKLGEEASGFKTSFFARRLPEILIAGQLYKCQMRVFHKCIFLRLACYERRRIMRIKSRVAVVTGGANGIGRALCRRFAAEGARAVIVADIQRAAAEEVAKETGCKAFAVNVAREAEVRQLVEEVIKEFGAIDLFCSNAGIGAKGGVEAADEEWSRSWEVNVMAHVYAARAVLPHMLARREGYLLQTVSAAGLLTQLGSAPYAVTKHAALALAEWIAITHGDQGIKVSALCPQGVRTNMLLRAEFGGGAFLLETALEPEQVAEEVVKGLAEERFLILPHPEVAEYFRRKAADYERWLRGMRRLQANAEMLRPSA
jgi:NAD(P)-dependent dehydrogenase (short-subunit alcohol dehydrogenase family)